MSASVPTNNSVQMELEVNSNLSFAGWEKFVYILHIFGFRRWDATDM